MRRNRGECLLVSCAMMGCLLVVIVLLLGALWYFLRPARPSVRPMVHQTPARTVEVQRERRQVAVQAPVTATPTPPAAAPVTVTVTETPRALATPSPTVEETPQLQDFAASVSADGYMLGMTAVAPSKNLVVRAGKLVEVREARVLQVDERQWKAGDTVTLAQLRAALPTRRESQKSERDGSVRHDFPVPGGPEVRVWLRQGRAQKFALREFQ